MKCETKVALAVMVVTASLATLIWLLGWQPVRGGQARLLAVALGIASGIAALIASGCCGLTYENKEIDEL